MPEKEKDEEKSLIEENEQNISPLKRLFSFRTVKTILKYFGIGLIVFVYAFFFLRMCTDDAPSGFGKPRYDSAAAQAAEAAESLTVYTQKPVVDIGNDGRFSISDVYYLDGADEIQLTVRYNQSTVRALMEKYNLETEPDGVPFTFILRDDKDRLYTAEIMETREKSVYVFCRLRVSKINLFTAQRAPSGAEYPHSSSELIYKGLSSAETVNPNVQYLYIDMYPEWSANASEESFGNPLLVYQSDLGLEKK